MTDAQQTARLVVRLSEENRLLRKREKRLDKALREAMVLAEMQQRKVTDTESARWRKVLNS